MRLQPLRSAVKPTRAMSPPGTYFVTFITWQRRRLFVVEPYVRLFLKTLYSYKRQGRYQLHAFVLMPEHVHLLLTPPSDVTLERAIQFIIRADIRAHSAWSSEEEKFGREDLRITGFAMPRISSATGVHPSESREARVGCECDGISLLFGVPGVQARRANLSG